MEVVAAVDKGGPLPQELYLYGMCSRFGALPDEGAIYNQDAGLLHRMAVLDNIYKALNRLRNSRGEQIHDLSGGERDILQSLVDMGLIFHA